MKIAVTYENGQIFQHFGRTQQFKIYEIAEGKVVSSHVVDTNGTGHGALAGFLQEDGVCALICGGIGGGAQNALSEAGIELFAGVAGDADAAVTAYLEGKLDFSTSGNCSHHDHHHGGDEGHDCHSHEGGCHSGGCHSGGCHH